MPEEDEVVVNRIFSAVGLDKLEMSADVPADHDAATLLPPSLPSFGNTNGVAGLTAGSSSIRPAQAEHEIDNTFIQPEETLQAADTNGTAQGNRLG